MPIAKAALLALSWTLLLAACAGGTRLAPTKIALVIGNAAYANAPPLVNPVNDAADMCAALRKVGFRTLCHTNLRDRAEFDARIAEYTAMLDANAVGLFYYSGHGVQAGSTNYLIPTEVQPRSPSEDPRRGLYAVDDLFDRLGRRPAQFQLVVLDACRADLFGQPARQDGRAVASRSTLIRALEGVARAGNGLQPIKDAPPGTIVLYATASRDVAFDGEGRNGPLTKHVLQHIGTKGIAVEEFLKRVIQGVEQETQKDYGKRQTPFIYGSFGGRYCFAGCPGDSDVPVPAAF
jgi:uncharacterized caspase-like protein